MTLTVIISGGQTGADQGALVAAQALGFKTGGWMPKTFRTEVGPNPTLAQRFGLREHNSFAFQPRTFANVRDSDGTIWVGRDGTPGFRCTYRAVEQYGRPFLNNPDAITLRQWVEQWQIRTLNVAGSRASVNPAAFQLASDLITAAFGRPEEAPVPRSGATQTSEELQTNADETGES